MVHLSIIEARLNKLDVKPSRWYKPELKELQDILVDNEDIIALVPGRYFGGYALLVATDLRLLLIDKRTFFLSLEDIRYDMISEVDFSSRLLDCTVQIFSVNKLHRFTSRKYRQHLKKLTTYIQQRVMQLRQQQNMGPIDNMPAQATAHGLNASLPLSSSWLPKSINRLPQHSAHTVGAATMKNLHRRYSAPNPYINVPLVTRRAVFGARLQS
jgi:hypothetical protein